MRGVTGSRTEGMGFSNLLSHKKPLAYAVLAGVAMAALIFSWDGAVVYIAVIAAYAFIQYAYDAFKKQLSVPNGRRSRRIGDRIRHRDAFRGLERVGPELFVFICLSLLVPHSLPAIHGAVLRPGGRSL